VVAGIIRQMVNENANQATDQTAYADRTIPWLSDTKTFKPTTMPSNSRKNGGRSRPRQSANA